MKKYRMKYTQLNLAEQQLLGFHHAKKGYSLKNLVSSMGLEKEEWEELKTSGMVNYLTDNEVETIDEHFN